MNTIGISSTGVPYDDVITLLEDKFNKEGVELYIDYAMTSEGKMPGEDLMLDLYYEKARSGHTNNQHWFPEMLFKNRFPPLTHQYRLNEEPRKILIKKGISPYNDLYSSTFIWPAKIEGHFTGVEGIVNDFLRFRLSNKFDTQELLAALRSNRAMRIYYAFLLLINLYRKKDVLITIEYEGKKVDYDYETLFLNEQGVRLLIKTAIFLSSSTWVSYKSNIYSAIFSEECVKQLPQNFQAGFSVWNRRWTGNSALYSLLSESELLVVIPLTEDGGRWNDIQHYHSVKPIEGNTVGDIAMLMYNWTSLNFDQKLYITKNSKHFPADL